MESSDLLFLRFVSSFLDRFSYAFFLVLLSVILFIIEFLRFDLNSSKMSDVFKSPFTCVDKFVSLFISKLIAASGTLFL